jgi:hypoxanthine phosphoribosyltransferase
MTPGADYPLPTRPPAESCGPQVHLGDVILDASTIAAKVQELADDISRDYAGRELLLISILKGGFIFMADLARAVTLDVEMDFLAISSYLKEHDETGNKAIRFLKDLDQPIKDKDALIVQDIVDTGLTLHYILRSLSLRGPRSLEICTLLDRPQQRLVDVSVRYRGFTVPDEFVVGYGFDYRQYFRNIPHVAHIDLGEVEPTFL